MLFGIDPAHKTVYHAGTVLASNYLAALLETALRCFEQAGIAREEATRLMRGAPPYQRSRPHRGWLAGPTVNSLTVVSSG